ncbi:hypothetical protein D3C76_879500 [compost metagenome]
MSMRSRICFAAAKIDCSASNGLMPSALAVGSMFCIKPLARPHLVLEPMALGL